MRLTLSLSAALVFVCLNTAALADDTPFDLESSSWMSFDRYKDKPANWLAPDQRAAVAQYPVIVPPPILPASLPIVTEPTRAIVTPVMPGLNKNFDIKVDTTEDDNRLSSPPTGSDDQLVSLQDNKWKDAVEAAHQKVLTGKEGDKDSSSSVRFASLPAWTLPEKKAMSLPVAPAEKKTPAPVKVAQPTLPPKPAQPAVSAADAAACAALDAYKKRQLQAIESDRQTLTALQNAIAQLGLQKQLDFMTGTTGTLSLQAAGSAKN